MFQQNVPPGCVAVPAGTHSVAIAVLLSCLCFVGAAQMYNRQVVKGVVMLVGTLATGVALGVITCGIGSLFIAMLMWPFGLVDAICIANKLNAGRVVNEWEFF